VKHKEKQKNEHLSRVKKEYFKNTAILSGIAVFFYSTPFYFFAFQFPNFNISSDKKALAARQTPFLFVGKWKIPLLYRARAPPINLNFQISD